MPKFSRVSAKLVIKVKKVSQILSAPTHNRSKKVRLNYLYEKYHQTPFVLKLVPEKVIWFSSHVEYSVSDIVSTFFTYDEIFEFSMCQ